VRIFYTECSKYHFQVAVLRSFLLMRIIINSLIHRNIFLVYFTFISEVIW